MLEEKTNEYFNVPKNLLGSDTPTPYMILIANVKKDNIPATTHVNNTARLQTVSEKQNPLYYQLIKKFDKLTNCPVIINTSFNVRGEPIVCTPQDAFSCFMKTEMDYLVMGNYLINKQSLT